MRTLIMLVAVLCRAGVAVGQQAGQAPKPGPEHQKLAIWVGDWQYEGQAKESRLGPAGEFSGQMTGHPILGGFFLEIRGHETLPLGDVDWVETYGYDPVGKKYTWTGFASDGSGTAGTYTLDGATISYAGTMTAAGKQYRIRGTSVFAPDLMSTVDKQEISTDGKIWAAFSERKFTRVKAAPAAGANTQAEQDTSTQRNKEVVRRWIVGLWDGMNFNLLTEMATPDYAYRGPDTGPDGLSAAACIELVKTTHGAFPDLHNTIEGQVAEGDRVVTWGTSRGTQRGALGEIPASGKSIALPWIMITEFRGGKIARDREFFDRLGLMQQLGREVPGDKPADPVPSVESMIGKADAAWAEAVGSRSIEQTLAFYAPEAVTAGSGMFPARGLADFRAAWARLFAEPAFALTWKAEHIVLIESGPLAYSSGTWKNGKQHGPYLAVWQKQTDGQWKIIIDSAWTMP